MAKVGVIVPVYGVEKYIERCARSLFEQTLEDIEYLFIDDCTPDRSIEILQNVLEDYPQRKTQVVIHRMEHNSGQAVVRERGTQIIKSEYVIHCDSDDYVDANMYKILYDKAIEGDYEMVVCDYATITDGVVSNKHCPVPESKFDCISQLLSHQFPSYMWNKLVKREIYQATDIEWPKGNLWEDLATMIQVIQKVERIAYINTPLYYYCFNPRSIVNNKSKENIVQNFLSRRENMKIMIKSLSNKALIKTYSDIIVDMKFNSLQLLYPYVNDRKIYDLLLFSYPNMVMTFLLSRHVTIRSKILYILALMRLYPVVLSVLKIKFR